MYLERSCIEKGFVSWFWWGGHGNRELKGTFNVYSWFDPAYSGRVHLLARSIIFLSQILPSGYSNRFDRRFLFLPSVSDFECSGLLRYSIHKPTEKRFTIYPIMLLCCIENGDTRENTFASRGIIGSNLDNWIYFTRKYSLFVFLGKDGSSM